MTTILVHGLLATGLSLVLGLPVRALLRRGQVLDHPTERSSHVRPVHRGGGVGPAVAALVMLALTPLISTSQRWALGLFAGLFALLGLLEDVVGVRALVRLGVQFVIAGAAASLLLDGLTGSLWRATFAVGAVLWLVAFANSYNFMDGIDGISVAQSVGAGVTWYLVGWSTDTAVLAGGGALVAGAALGFAPYNLPRARMFLGDVGSYFFGAWLAATAVLGLRAGVPPEAVLAPLALYVADTGLTLVRRIARGESWYLPHRDHAYQRLGNAGWSHLRASALVGACIAVCGALGAVSLSRSVPARVAADVALVAVIGAYLVLPAGLARTQRSPVALA